MSHLNCMPLFDAHMDFKTSIERAETTAEEGVRRRKVKIFRWQGWTAAICLIARAALLFHYVKCMIGVQGTDFIPKLHLHNLVAAAFLFMEIAFTREHGLRIGKRRAKRKSVYRLYPQHLQSIQFASKARFHPRLWIGGIRVPTVDILVFYCGEEVRYFIPIRTLNQVIEDHRIAFQPLNKHMNFFGKSRQASADAPR